MAEMTPDFSAITNRQQQVWATGDFNVVARIVMAVSDALVETANPRPGKRVLDVACGSGNGALSAARRSTEVTGIDYVPALIERAQARARADGATVDFRVGDAQALPFPDASFDTVMSVFGVMFAPNQEKTASELWRVCTPGGTIALANWAPTGFGGDLFRMMGKYAPPPPGLKPGVRWGTEAGIKELFGAGTRIRLATRRFNQYFRSVDEMVDVYCNWFGPAARALAAQDAPGQAAMRHDLGAVFSKHNRATDGVAEIDSEYAEVLITR
jgi:SAM-dependent methyltransferase